MNDYIVISKKWLDNQIRIMGKDEDILQDTSSLNKLSAYLNVITNSKPLQPIIEDAFEAGENAESYRRYFHSDNPDPRPSTELDFKEYIENLKI